MRGDNSHSQRFGSFTSMAAGPLVLLGWQTHENDVDDGHCRRHENIDANKGSTPISVDPNHGNHIEQQRNQVKKKPKRVQAGVSDSPIHECPGWNAEEKANCPMWVESQVVEEIEEFKFGWAICKCVVACKAYYNCERVPDPKLSSGSSTPVIKGLLEAARNDVYEVQLEAPNFSMAVLFRLNQSTSKMSTTRALPMTSKNNPCSSIE